MTAQYSFFLKIFREIRDLSPDNVKIPPSPNPRHGSSREVGKSTNKGAFLAKFTYPVKSICCFVNHRT